jgi:hypothetical protein
VRNHFSDQKTARSLLQGFHFIDTVLLQILHLLYNAAFITEDAPAS